MRLSRLLTTVSLYTMSLPLTATTGTSQESLRLTYLGAAGWEISDGKIVVLVDPYLSRFKDPTPNDRVVPEDTRPQITPQMFVSSDTAVVDAHIARADLILITHGHPDHALDMPYIARKTGAIVVESESTGNIARALAVPDAQIRAVQGHDSLVVKGVSIRVVPSIHGIFNKPGVGPPPRIYNFPATAKPPFHIGDFAAGETLAYLVRIGGHQILIFGSMNYIEAEVDGLRPDIALVGAMPERSNVAEYTPRLMRALGNPAIVLPTHWDRFNTPYELGQPQAALDRVRVFADEVRATSPGTRVIIPEHLKPFAIGPASLKGGGGNPQH